MNRSQHINREIDNFTLKQMVNNQMQLMLSNILSCKLLLLEVKMKALNQSIRGKFLTTLDLMVSYNDKDFGK